MRNPARVLVVLAASLAAVAAATCDSVWSANACVGSACYTCGARINYLISTGKSTADAKYQVAVTEFPSVCGGCAPTCDDVWNTAACVGAACYTCGARIEYLVSTGMTELEAQYQIGAQEFPNECGWCEPTCDDVWSAQACVNNACYTCGARIEYLIKTGKSKAEANYQIGVTEFPSVCGPCGPTCADVWNSNACVGTECYTCGARITHLISQGMSAASAQYQVGETEFPSVCGPCASGATPASSSPTKAATPTPTKAATPKPPTTTPTPATNVPKASLVLRNQCSYTVWPGLNGRKSDGSYFFGPAGSTYPAGFQLGAGESRTIPIPNGISSFTTWPRTGCAYGSDGRFKCETGECGNGVNNWDGTCYSSGPEGGTSLAEATIMNGIAYYDLSLVDGYTIPIRINAHHGTKVAGVADAYNCGSPSCVPDMTFAGCPPETRVTVNGRVVGCNNIHKAIYNAASLAAYPALQTYYNNVNTRSHTECSCLVGSCAGSSTAELLQNLKNGNTVGVDKTGYCCSPLNPLYSSPAEVSGHICYAEDKPKPLNNFAGGLRYDQIFKNMCPEAYSWQFDDEASTFLCGGSSLSLEIVFC